MKIFHNLDALAKKALLCSKPSTYSTKIVNAKLINTIYLTIAFNRANFSENDIKVCQPKKSRERESLTRSF